MGRKIHRPPSLVGAIGTAAGLALLVALFVTDLKHRLLPNAITIPGTVAGFAFSFVLRKNS